MQECFVGVSMLGIPVAGSQVKGVYLFAVSALQHRTECFGKQSMVAIPMMLCIKRDEKQIRECGADCHVTDPVYQKDQSVLVASD